MLFPFSAFRTGLNDHLVLLSFCVGAVLGSALIRAVGSHRQPLQFFNTILCIGIAVAVIGLCVVPIVRLLLVGSTLGGALSVFSSYLLISVLVTLSSLLLSQELAGILLQRAGSLFICILFLIVEVVLASWAAIDASLALVILIVSVASSFSLLFLYSLGFKNQSTNCSEDNRGYGKKVAVEVSEFVYASVFITFGMVLACVVLPPVDSLIKMVLVLPMIAIALCISVVITKARGRNTWFLAISIATSLLLPIMVGTLFHSLLAGFGLCAFLEVGLLAEVGIDIGLTSNFQRVDIKRFAFLSFSLGLVFSCPILFALNHGVPGVASSRSGLLLLGVLFASIVLVSLLCIIGVCIICSSILDALSCGRCANVAMYPDTLQRVRAYFTLHGFSDFEIEVALRTASGSTVAAISRDLHYSAGSVKAARARAYRLLSVHDAYSLNAAFSEVVGL